MDSCRLRIRHRHTAISCLCCTDSAITVGLIVCLYLIIRQLRHDEAAPLQPQSPRHAIRPKPLSYIHVCMAFDEHNILGVMAAINSINVNSRHHVYFHLVTDRRSASALRSWMKVTTLQNVTYEVAEFDPVTLKGKVKVRGTRADLANPMNYARYYYTDLFPSLHGKVLHIDSDVIVQADVFNMFSTPLNVGHVAAFSDDCTTSMKRFSENQNTYAVFLNFNNKRIQSLELRPGTCSFNVGIYVFNADLWRQMNLTRKLEFWMETNSREDLYGSGKADGGSQPPMMIEFYNKYSPLDPMWNLRYLGRNPKERYSEHFVRHAKLLHWSGPFKPWSGAAQFTRIWDKYYVPDPTGQNMPVRRLRQPG